MARSISILPGKEVFFLKSSHIRKLALAGLLVAVAVVCSPLSIPVGASKCFPVQHLVNVLAGVLLGPWYGVGMAFCTSLVRVMLGTGSLLAFPGSMCGALLCGLLYRAGKKLPLASLGELVGTGLLGALAAYPLAALVMAKETALFAYVLPFGISSLGGTAIAVLLMGALQRAQVLARLQRAEEG